MPEFMIYEAQEDIRTCIWRYRIEAESAAEALRQVQDGEVDPVLFSQGDSEAGDKSGWAIVENGDDTAACNLAVDRMVGQHEGEDVYAQAERIDAAKV